MDAQTTHKGGFASSFWLQRAALVVVTVVAIAPAAKYIW